MSDVCVSVSAYALHRLVLARLRIDDPSFEAIVLQVIDGLEQLR